MEAFAAKPFDYLFKINMVGDSWVGKTSMINRFMKDSIQIGSQATIGLDFQIKTIEIESKIIKLQVWDALSGVKGSEVFEVFTIKIHLDFLFFLILQIELHLRVSGIG